MIDSYQSNPQSLLSLSQTNLAPFNNIDSNPRFTGYHDVPTVPGATAPIQLPYAPPVTPTSDFTFDYSINDHQKTPYAETFNLTVQHEFAKSFSVTASYVGRLGRHLLQNLDVAMPTNFYDGGSGMTYFQAATIYRKLIDQGVDAAVIQNSGYFQNLFPNFTATDGVTGVTYTGAQGYYASLMANSGNETNTLFQADTDPTASSSGQSFRFFYPQTSSVYVQSTTGVSNYNAFQLSVRQVLHYGLEYDVNYTLSHSLDEGSDPERNTNGSPYHQRILSAPVVRKLRLRRAPQHHRQLLDSLALCKGKPYLSSGGWTDRLVGGWELTGVVHYSTGFPLQRSRSERLGNELRLQQQHGANWPHSDRWPSLRRPQ